MASILHFRKRLDGPPVALAVSEIEVRQLIVPADVPAWLELRERAVAGLVPAPRPWLHADYEAEMFDKPWFHAEWNWLAVAKESPSQPVGAVTLAIREGTERVPVVHWLLVDPAWRRRGVGRLLMTHLERAAWDAGSREVQLETHTGWAAAVTFYQSMGYAPVRDPAPR
jgi:GNAT superfamily N-acetyltransferase